MKKSTRITIIIIAMIIAIPSLFNYALHDSWQGVIGFGIGLLILAITNRFDKKEIERKARMMDKTQKRINKFLKGFLYFLIVINFLASIWLFYKGSTKQGVLLAEITLLIFLSNWRMP